MDGKGERIESVAIRGMTCAACSARVERAIRGMEGVREASVNLAAETLRVTWDPGAVTIDEIAHRVTELGYEAVLPQGGETAAPLRLAVRGMTCAACSARVERVLTALPGVTKAAVSLAAESAVVDPGPGVDRGELRQAAIESIQRVGYQAEMMEDVADTADRWAQRKADVQARLERMRRRLLPAFVCTALLLYLSMGGMIGLPTPVFLTAEADPFRYAAAQLLLLLPVLWSGRDFYRTGVPNLWRLAPNMDSLIAVGTGAAVLYSVWGLAEIAAGGDPLSRVQDLYFESAAVLITLVSLGRYLETRAKAKASDALERLMNLAPEIAVLSENGGTRDVPVREVVPRQILLVRPGSRVPVDGVVVEGRSSVDESLLTGESAPVVKSPGDAVTGGSMNLHGVFSMRVESVGADTVLARIIRLVQDAQGSKAPIANLADQVSYYFVPTVMAVAVVSGLAWHFLGEADASFSLRIFVAVLVIACPCAMGLATPMSILVGTDRGAQLGVLIKNGQALEQAGRTQAVLLDKTGTVTHGRPVLTDVLPLPGSSLNEAGLLAVAASVEVFSEHPLAAAVARAAHDRGLSLYDAQDFEAVPGMGARAFLAVSSDRTPVCLGTLAFLQDNGIPLEAGGAAEAQALSLAEQGKTPLFVAVDGVLAGVLALADELRAEAPAVVRRLRAMGLRVMLLTGDNAHTAWAVASQVGIEEVAAELLPEQKAARVRELQSAGVRTAMVGDGVNDAPALALADVGVAMGGGIDVAMEAGDIVLMRDSLDGLSTALSLSRATMRNIRQNLFWAFGYNVLGIPVAAGVLFLLGGPTLSPMIAGAAMAFSSVSVVANALRLKRFQPELSVDSK